MTSPVMSLMSALIPKMSGTSEFGTFFSDEIRYRILKELFFSFYGEMAPSQIVFDTNRLWTARLSLIDKIFPDAQVICCVRDIRWIIDSVERMVRKNPAHNANMFNEKSAKNVYGRVETLMNTEGGLVGLAWTSLREAWFGEHTDKLIVVRYESLTQNPEATLKLLYEFLGEVWHPHQFDNLEFDETGYDERLGMPGLHKIRQRVEFQERETILPPDIFQKYADLNFWSNPKLNTKSVRII